MKTRTKVVVDESLGRLALFLLNMAARLLGRILGINHTFSQKPARIAVCKFLGMGSIIQSTPLLQTLRKNYPDAQIIFITSVTNNNLLNNISAVNETWTIDDSGIFSVLTTTWRMLLKSWKKKIDLYIDLETYSYYSAALATLTCARNRLGFYRAERNIRMGVHTHMMFFNARAPIAQAYLQMARLAGCTEMVHELYPFPVQQEDRDSCRKKLALQDFSADKKYVIVNPNASDLRIERRWPMQNFSSLLQELRSSFPDVYFILIGAMNEWEWVEQVYQSIPENSRERMLNSAGLFTLTELFALIDGAELVITNDTGPMHIAFALKKKTVCLFGPATPSQYGQNPFAYGLFANIYCSPCVHDFLTPPCKGDNQCMKRITIGQVTELCAKLLRGESVSPGQYIFPEIEYTKTDGRQTLGIVERN